LFLSECSSLEEIIERNLIIEKTTPSWNNTFL